MSSWPTSSRPRPEVGKYPVVDCEVTHTYPEAGRLAGRVGGDALLVLHVVLCHASVIDGEWIAAMSTRDISARLPNLSKDTVHRRLRDLRHVGVIELLPPSASRRAAPTYRIHLAATGIAVGSLTDQAPPREQSPHH